MNLEIDQWLSSPRFEDYEKMAIEIIAIIARKSSPIGAQIIEVNSCEGLYAMVDNALIRAAFEGIDVSDEDLETLLAYTKREHAYVPDEHEYPYVEKALEYAAQIRANRSRS
jgi:hypothetical protein